MAVAIQDLKKENYYRGEHLLDTFHIIRNISKKTKKDGLVRALRNAIFAKTDKEYNISLKEAI